MQDDSNPKIYAFTGGNGSGKTTYALKISKEKGALFLSLDKTIKAFNQAINSYEDYMNHYEKALKLMSENAIAFLKKGGSVVFDFGGGLSSRPWLKQVAELGSAQIQIYHLEVPKIERLRRIQQRNAEKDKDVYFFHMSDDEFNRQNQIEPVPPPEESGVTVQVVKNMVILK